MDNQKREHIRQLADKWMQGKLTPEEHARFEEWYASFDDEELFLKDTDYSNAEQLKEHMYYHIVSQIDNDEPYIQRSFVLRRVGVLMLAAAVLIGITIGFYFYNIHTKGFSDDKGTSPQLTDIQPGTNKATLTLADGRAINLSNSQEGIVVAENDVKYTDGSEVLSKDEKNKAPEIHHIPRLVLRTPKGGQYQITLPDGTRVWLNAASSLSYPVKFTGKERLVALTGEAYFEVKPYKMPFRVKTAGQEIEVLGTHFNISSYEEDAAIKTTLLEGSIKVTATVTAVSRLLTPGQQAVQEQHSGNIKVAQVDAESAIAWKNGLFVFDDESLEKIMSKVARWYDLEVVYTKDVKKDRLFGGSVSRYDNVSKVLDKLELTGGVRFKVEERRIMVMK